MRNTPAKFGGRKSKYAPEYCDKIVEWSSEGLSIKECLHRIGISTATCTVWAKDHAEWRDAMDRAHIAWHSWYMQFGRRHLESTKDDELIINVPIYIYLGKSIGKLYDTRDHISIDHQLTAEQVDNLSDDDIDRLLTGRRVDANSA